MCLDAFYFPFGGGTQMGLIAVSNLDTEEVT